MISDSKWAAITILLCVSVVVQTVSEWIHRQTLQLHHKTTTRTSPSISKSETKTHITLVILNENILDAAIVYEIYKNHTPAQNRTLFTQSFLTSPKRGLSVAQSKCRPLLFSNPDLCKCAICLTKSLLKFLSELLSVSPQVNSCDHPVSAEGHKHPDDY